MILRSLTASVIVMLALPAIMFAAVIGTWAADRDLPVSTISVQVLTPVVPPGGKLQIKFVVQRSRPCAIHVDRYTRDSAEHRDFLDDVDTRDAAGPIGRDELVTTVSVPDFYAEGPAKYVTLPQYACNPTHWIFPIRAPQREIEFMIRR
jgi:hypothetical protein